MRDRERRGPSENQAINHAALKKMKFIPSSIFNLLTVATLHEISIIVKFTVAYISIPHLSISTKSFYQVSAEQAICDF